MMERYSHIRMEAKRRAVDDLSGTDFALGVAQNWAQLSVTTNESSRSLGDPHVTCCFLANTSFIRHRESGIAMISLACDHAQPVG
jgi:hypothetical protein